MSRPNTPAGSRPSSGSSANKLDAVISLSKEKQIVSQKSFQLQASTRLHSSTRPPSNEVLSPTRDAARKLHRLVAPTGTLRAVLMPAEVSLAEALEFDLANDTARALGAPSLDDATSQIPFWMQEQLEEKKQRLAHEASHLIEKKMSIAKAVPQTFGEVLGSPARARSALSAQSEFEKYIEEVHRRKQKAPVMEGFAQSEERQRCVTAPLMDDERPKGSSRGADRLRELIERSKGMQLTPRHHTRAGESDAATAHLHQPPNSSSLSTQLLNTSFHASTNEIPTAMHGTTEAKRMGNRLPQSTVGTSCDTRLRETVAVEKQKPHIESVKRTVSPKRHVVSTANHKGPAANAFIAYHSSGYDPAAIFKPVRTTAPSPRPGSAASTVRQLDTTSLEALRLYNESMKPLVQRSAGDTDAMAALMTIIGSQSLQEHRRTTSPTLRTISPQRTQVDSSVTADNEVVPQMIVTSASMRIQRKWKGDGPEKGRTAENADCDETAVENAPTTDGDSTSEEGGSDLGDVVPAIDVPIHLPHSTRKNVAITRKEPKKQRPIVKKQEFAHSRPMMTSLTTNAHAVAMFDSSDIAPCEPFVVPKSPRGSLKSPRKLSSSSATDVVVEQIMSSRESAHKSVAPPVELSAPVDALPTDPIYQRTSVMPILLWQPAGADPSSPAGAAAVKQKRSQLWREINRPCGTSDAESLHARLVREAKRGAAVLPSCVLQAPLVPSGELVCVRKPLNYSDPVIATFFKAHFAGWKATVEDCVVQQPVIEADSRAAEVQEPPAVTVEVTQPFGSGLSVADWLVEDASSVNAVHGVPDGDSIPFRAGETFCGEILDRERSFASDDREASTAPGSSAVADSIDSSPLVGFLASDAGEHNEPLEQKSSTKTRRSTAPPSKSIPFRKSLLLDVNSITDGPRSPCRSPREPSTATNAPTPRHSPRLSVSEVSQKRRLTDSASGDVRKSPREHSLRASNDALCLSLPLTAERLSPLTRAGRSQRVSTPRSAEDRSLEPPSSANRDSVTSPLIKSPRTLSTHSASENRRRTLTPRGNSRKVSKGDGVPSPKSPCLVAPAKVDQDVTTPSTAANKLRRQSRKKSNAVPNSTPPIMNELDADGRESSGSEDELDELEKFSQRGVLLDVLSDSDVERSPGTNQNVVPVISPQEGGLLLADPFLQVITYFNSGSNKEQGELQDESVMYSPEGREGDPWNPSASLSYVPEDSFQSLSVSAFVSTPATTAAETAVFQQLSESSPSAVSKPRLKQRRWLSRLATLLAAENRSALGSTLKAALPSVEGCDRDLDPATPGQILSSLVSPFAPSVRSAMPVVTPRDRAVSPSGRSVSPSLSTSTRIVGSVPKTRIAVVIAISAYEDSTIMDSLQCETEGNNIVTLLSSIGFRVTHMTMASEDESYRPTTRDAILRCIDRATKGCGKMKREDFISVVYVCGAGFIGTLPGDTAAMGTPHHIFRGNTDVVEKCFGPSAKTAKLSAVMLPSSTVASLVHQNNTLSIADLSLIPSCVQPLVSDDRNSNRLTSVVRDAPAVINNLVIMDAVSASYLPPFSSVVSGFGLIGGMKTVGSELFCLYEHRNLLSLSLYLQRALSGWATRDSRLSVNGVNAFLYAHLSRRKIFCTTNASPFFVGDVDIASSSELRFSRNDVRDIKKVLRGSYATITLTLIPLNNQDPTSVEFLQHLRSAFLQLLTADAVNVPILRCLFRTVDRHVFAIMRGINPVKFMADTNGAFHHTLRAMQQLRKSMDDHTIEYKVWCPPSASFLMGELNITQQLTRSAFLLQFENSSRIREVKRAKKIWLEKVRQMKEARRVLQGPGSPTSSIDDTTQTMPRVIMTSNNTSNITAAIEDAMIRQGKPDVSRAAGYLRSPLESRFLIDGNAVHEIGVQTTVCFLTTEYLALKMDRAVRCFGLLFGDFIVRDVQVKRMDRQHIELHAVLSKIQALWRGKMTRKFLQPILPLVRLEIALRNNVALELADCLKRIHMKETQGAQQIFAAAESFSRRELFDVEIQAFRSVYLDRIEHYHKASYRTYVNVVRSLDDEESLLRQEIVDRKNILWPCILDFLYWRKLVRLLRDEARIRQRNEEEAENKIKNIGSQFWRIEKKW